MSDYRVTQSEVKEIIDTDVTNVLPFIAAAEVIVDDNLQGTGLSDSLLKEIERWLAAHFVAIRDPRLKKSVADKAEGEFHLGTPGKGLESTPYGQQAIAMDTSGVLTNMGKKQMAEIVVLA